MSTPNVSPAQREQDEVVTEMRIPAPPERVFQAITDATQIALWWRNETVGIENVVLEPRVGGRWGYQTDKPVDGTQRFIVHGEVIEYDPPRLLAYTWFANLHDDNKRRTVVRWELTGEPGGTLLRVTHSGLACQPKARTGYSSGWPSLLQRVRDLVERELKGAPQASPVPSSDEIVAELEIAAPPDRVFQALVDPSQVVRWWGQAGIYRCTKFESDLRVGGIWRSMGVDGNGRPFEIVGEYMEIDAPRLLCSTWRATWTGNIETRIRWELEPAKTGTLVRICHSGFAAHPELAQAYRGWPRMLTWLQALLEKGETVERRQPASWR